MGRSPDDLKKLWLTSLRHERRASPNTLRAYGDDVARFLAFVYSEHLRASAPALSAPAAEVEAEEAVEADAELSA